MVVVLVLPRRRCSAAVPAGGSRQQLRQAFRRQEPQGWRWTCPCRADPVSAGGSSTSRRLPDAAHHSSASAGKQQQRQWWWWWVAERPCDMVRRPQRGGARRQWWRVRLQGRQPPTFLGDDVLRQRATLQGRQRMRLMLPGTYVLLFAIASTQQRT